MAEYRFIFTNNARSSLAGPINGNLLALAAGTGNLFPNPVVGQAFKLTLIDAATRSVREILNITARNGDTCTIGDRATENTSEAAWQAGDIAAHMMTAETTMLFLQAGDIDLSGYYKKSDFNIADYELKSSVVAYDVQAQGGLENDNSKFKINLGNLPGGSTIQDNDLALIQTAEPEDTNSSGVPAARTWQSVAAYISGKIKQSNTFVVIPPNAQSVTATFEAPNGQAVPSNQQINVNLQGEGTSFCQISSSELQILQPGIYFLSANITAKTYQASGELQYATIFINQNNNPLTHQVSSFPSFGEVDLDLSLSAISYAAAGDTFPLGLFTHAQNNDDHNNVITSASLTVVKVV